MHVLFSLESGRLRHGVPFKAADCFMLLPWFGQGMLSFDAPVLAIAQEESQPTCRAHTTDLAQRTLEMPP